MNDEELLEYEKLSRIKKLIYQIIVSKYNVSKNFICHLKLRKVGFIGNIWGEPCQYKMIVDCYHIVVDIIDITDGFITLIFYESNVLVKMKLISKPDEYPIEVSLVDGFE